MVPFKMWWEGNTAQTRPNVPYAIPCSCGHVITGMRTRNPQTITCSKCRRPLFVLPLSPLQNFEAPVQEITPTTLPRGWFNRLLITLATLLAIALVFLLYLLYQVLANQDSDPPRHNHQKKSFSRTEKTLAEHRQTAATLIDQGLFRQAEKHLKQVIAQAGHADSESVQQLRWQYREIACFANLSGEPLQTMLELAAALPENEWQAEFAARYQGKTILLDTTVEWDDRDKRWLCSWPFMVRGEGVVLQVDRLFALKALPKKSTQRVLLGLYIESIDRLDADRWFVSFDSEQSLLLTNASALAITCPPLDSSETRTLLLEQKKYRDRQDRSDLP